MPIKSGMDLVAEAKSRIREMSARDAKSVLERGERAVYLDVREPNEWNLGHIPGAVHLPRGIMETRIEQMIPRDARVIIYCAAGNRSALAADTLQQMGYDNVVSLAGGWREWVTEGGKVEG